MVKVLQIGATGQVGYALMHALTEAGHDVTVLVRDAGRLAFPDSVKVVARGEFTAESFSEVLTNAECAVYGVGLPEQFVFDTEIFDRINRRLLGTFLSALDTAGVGRLIYISTYEVFSPRDGVIREDHPVVAQPLGLSPYFSSMTRAYQDVTAFANRTKIRLTTIHPAAVYGGLNTGDGFTAAIENMLNRRIWRLPVIPPGRFPLVHADSLAAGIVSALPYEGPFVLSDDMCDLKSLARALRRQVRSYVPPQVPATCLRAAAPPIEAFARALRRRPILSRVQLDFITAGIEPLTDRATTILGFTPLPIHAGLHRYLADRPKLLAAHAPTGSTAI